MARAARARLSAIDLSILDCLKCADRALGAYEIRDRVADPGRAPGPPIIYRGLERLIDLGFVHRVGSLRAFVPCRRPLAAHCAVLAVCPRCQRVTERADAAASRLVRAASRMAVGAVGAVVEQIEIQMPCERCRAQA